MAMAQVVQSKPSTFIQQMLPVVRAANQGVAKMRVKLVMLRHKSVLSPADKTWLAGMMVRVKLPVPKDVQVQDWSALLQRVDTVPAGLVLAQAAIESGWGHSRFAREGNNYFGRWCYTKGCGMVPKKRPKGREYAVKVFPTIRASVNDYLWNINTHAV